MSKNSAYENQKFIADELKNFFDSDNWIYEYNDENKVFTGEISIDGPISSVTFLYLPIQITLYVTTFFLFLQVTKNVLCRQNI